MTTVDVNLMADLKRFGAADINDCFSCGNCTAICPLADDDAVFPRSIIRLAQVGLKDQLVGAKELWTCYQCGMCTDRCPQQADPSEFMATARRYAIAHYDKTRLARTLYTKPVIGVIIAVVAALFFAAFFQTLKAGQGAPDKAVFGLNYSIIHTTGLVVMAIAVLFSAIGLVLLIRNIARRDGVTWASLLKGGKAWKRTWRALWYAVGVESLGQKRYREDCVDDQPVEPLYRRRWLIHFLTLWGFLGLFLATILNYLLDLLGIVDTGTWHPIYYPIRLLGTIAGLALMYGVTWFFVRRFEERRAGTSTTKMTDWLFLTQLWLIGLTGFLIELSLYLPGQHPWADWIFLVHAGIAMELILFLPFTKLAHVMYRPVSLFFYGLAKS